MLGLSKKNVVLNVSAEDILLTAPNAELRMQYIVRNVYNRGIGCNIRQFGSR